MADVGALADLTDAFLIAAQDALAFTDAGAPERAFVSPGEPALDCCEQLTVWAQTIGDANLAGGSGALSDAKRINRGGLAQIVINIQITRCGPSGATSRGGALIPPSPAALTAASHMIDEDGWALWLGMSTALKHGDLAETCSGAERLGAQKLTPQGTCIGWTVQYRIPLQGGRLGT